jgi:hypothetical protein
MIAILTEVLQDLQDLQRAGSLKAVKWNDELKFSYP